MLKSLPNGRLHLSASNKVFNWFSADSGTIASERWETLNKAQAHSFVQKTGKFFSKTAISWELSDTKNGS